MNPMCYVELSMSHKRALTANKANQAPGHTRSSTSREVFIPST